jgi:hypothetical protein
MKVSYRRLWFSIGAFCLILPAISVATSGRRVFGAGEIVQKPQKNPKLSAQLVLLSRSVKQESERPAVAGAVSAPAGFSKDALPKPLRDAIRAGQMQVTNSAEVLAYIEITETNPQNLSELRNLGVKIEIIGNSKLFKTKGEVLTKVPTVQGLLPITMINQVSALSFVRYIRLPDYGFSSTGSVTSQGERILQAAQARAQFGVDGTGVRVGVISGGIGGVFATGCTNCGPATAIPSPIATGDLPKATATRNSSGVLVSVGGGITAQSFRADGDLEDAAEPDGSGGVNAEGTAMLEIVHDLAPGARLFFANFDTSLSFSQAVDFLAANTDVVVDDVGFFTPPFDGTSDVSTSTATALNTDSNPIRGYFTAVANVAQDHYGGMYLDSGKSGKSITGQAGGLHSFQAISGVTVDNENLGPSVTDPATIPPLGEIIVLLTWNDSADASSNDYDLFLVPLSCSGFAGSTGLPQPPCSISGPPLASSTNPQTGTQPPVEELIFENPSASSPIAVGIVIQNAGNAAAGRTFDLFVLGSLADSAIPDHNFVTVSGSVPAESDAGGSPVSVMSVGAIDQTQCSVSGSCSGSVERYSSQGPTEATPQADSRMKPDVTATDDVSITGAGGFGFNGSSITATGECNIGRSPCFFPGTSAAAPHAAAVAALVLQAMFSSTAGQSPATVRANLRDFLTSTAVPLPGVSQAIPNNIEGFGLLDALAAVTAAQGLPSGSFSLSSDPASVNIAAPGQGGSSTITLTGADGFTGTVNFSCSVSPVPVNDPPTCFVSPASAALGPTTTTASVALRISTTAGLNSAVLPSNRSDSLSYIASFEALALIGVVLTGIKRHPTGWAPSLALIALVGLAISLSCCAGRGGSNQINLGTPAGSYTVTVVGSSGAAAQSTSLSLTIE